MATKLIISTENIEAGPNDDRVLQMMPFLKKSMEKSQPEVINPKTGLPFNLKDPELPVVNDPGHTFKYYYWKMPRSQPVVMLGYLQEYWEYFNHKRFKGTLKMGRFALKKNTSALTFKTRGTFYGQSNGLGLIEIHPALFKAPHEGWINHTLVHEMAHQKVFQTGGDPSKENIETQGHGPRWQMYMREAGLQPERYSQHGNMDYFNEKDKAEYADRLTENSYSYKRQVQIMDEHGEQVTPKPGMIVRVPSLYNILPEGKVLHRSKNKHALLKWVVEIKDKGGNTITQEVEGKHIYNVEASEQLRKILEQLGARV